MNEPNEVTGMIEQEENRVLFVGEDYRFVFLPAAPDYKNEHSPVVSYKKAIRLKALNGFIRGQTFTGETILIFTGQDVELAPTYTFSTDLYILGTGLNRLESCDAVTFRGGILNSLFMQNSLHFETAVTYELTGNEKDDKAFTSVRYKDDSVFLLGNTDLIESSSICSGVQRSWSAQNGWDIHNTGAEMTIKFVSNQTVTDVFRPLYRNILELCRFMSFRKAISFEKVQLFAFYKIRGEKKLMPIADCHIKAPDQAASPSVFKCLRFDCLGERTARLYEMIKNRNGDKNGKKYVAEFIPGTDAEARHISTMQIRDICTSLEQEAENYSSKGSDAVKSLKDELLPLIKEKKDKGLLTDREYNYILGNMSLWSLPAAEKFVQLYDRFKEEVSPLCTRMGKTEVTETELKEMVDLRNGLTHGSFQVFSTEIAKTAYICMGVAYASILTRCGLTTDEIRSLMERGMLS